MGEDSHGRRNLGSRGALPAMVPTCSWLPVTRLTRGVTGWGGEAIIRLRAGQSLMVTRRLQTIGCLQTGYR